MGSYQDIEVGGVYPTNNHGLIEVLCISSATDADVKFIDTGYKTKAELGQIRRGTIKDWSNSLRERIGEVLPTTMYGDVMIGFVSKTLQHGLRNSLDSPMKAGNWIKTFSSPVIGSTDQKLAVLCQLELIA